MVRRWLPSTVGFLVGLSVALYYAWAVNPVEYIQTAPGSLRSEYRRSYLQLIAHSYVSTGNLGRASARLALFDSEDMPAELAALAQSEAAQGDAPADAQALALLASGLGAQVATEAPTPPSTHVAGTLPSSTPEPSPSSSPSAVRASSSTPATENGIRFEIEERLISCQGSDLPPQLMIEVLDDDGEPIPGIELTVIWDEGQDRFFTGLKPEISPGFADFVMETGVRYALQVAGSDVLVDDLVSESCRWENGQYPGSVSLVIRGLQP